MYNPIRLSIGRYTPNPHAERLASVDGSYGSRIRRKKKISESSNSVTFNNSKLSTSAPAAQSSSSRGSSILARPRSYTLPTPDCSVSQTVIQRPAPYRALTRAVTKAPHEDLRSLYYLQVPISPTFY
jgi:hypothetical protein